MGMGKTYGTMFGPVDDISKSRSLQALHFSHNTHPSKQTSRAEYESETFWLCPLAVLVSTREEIAEVCDNRLDEIVPLVLCKRLHN